MEDFEQKKVIKDVYKAITSIKKPLPGAGFITKLYDMIKQLGKAHGFKVENNGPFTPIKYYKDEKFCAQVETQFGSKRDSYRTIYSLSRSGAMVGVYITSSKSMGFPIHYIIKLLSRSEDSTTDKFIVYDIETGKHMLENIDPQYNKTYRAHPVNLFGGPKKYKKGYSYTRRKRVYGKKN